MNDNSQFLTVVDYSLHDPALEVLRRMKALRIGTRLKVHDKATKEKRTKAVEFVIYDIPVHVTNANEALENAVKGAVEYFNANRKKQVRYKGSKLSTFEPKEATKAAE